MSIPAGKISPLCGPLAALLLLCSGNTPAQQDTDVELSTISGDIEAPRRHSRIRQTERLEPAEAERIYQAVKGALQRGYGSAGSSLGEGYLSLERFNTVPYLSSSHGNHYLNNYGSEEASVYAQFEDAGRLPVGAVIYKDSFSVASNLEVVLGPLFIMEKMPAGFNPVSGDWKYIQVQPTGLVLGETNGGGSEKVRYCIECHLTRQRQDHLFFIPEAARPR